eukprot:3034161-Amphidinium_carterae.1
MGAPSVSRTQDTDAREESLASESRSRRSGHHTSPHCQQLSPLVEMKGCKGCAKEGTMRAFSTGSKKVETTAQSTRAAVFMFMT